MLGELLIKNPDMIHPLTIEVDSRNPNVFWIKNKGKKVARISKDKIGTVITIQNFIGTEISQRIANLRSFESGGHVLVEIVMNLNS